MYSGRRKKPETVKVSYYMVILTKIYCICLINNILLVLYILLYLKTCLILNYEF